MTAADTPGQPYGEQLAQELADVTAEDGSVWTYDAKSGGYISPDWPDVICDQAATVAHHTGGDHGTVRQARPDDYPKET